MDELPTSYDPSLTEDEWYKFWEQHHHFKADAHSSKPSYCIILPPPNVTGVLHMGHALVDTIQDILIRYKRKKGFEVLWVPGTDHAGISTQTVVERHLMAKEGKRRVDYPREEFLSHVFAWKDDHQSKIISQLKKLGCSCDWSRLRFTMDDEANFAVKSIFKQMFDEGLIYQGDYLVNWDPVTETALADDEVEYEEKSSFLWHLRYPVAGTNESIIIATTRPETMLGDTAVAVSPKDPRYQHLIGSEIDHPLTGRRIPIIADDFVDPSFGTGAVKITPAHDFNDYEMALRHHLPMINIMEKNGTLNNTYPPFKGFSMQEARKVVVQTLQQLDLLEKIEPHTHNVGVSYRSKAVIEPYLSKQWFVRITKYKQKLIDAVALKKVDMIPSYWEKTYFHWIDNLRDWCISRQLWWGHRIPVWHHKKDPTRKICYIDEGLPPEVAANPDDWKQDEDVLDTWFSSGLWPFSSLGWPHDKDYVKKFYPTSTLVTGHDILFFWVARMIFFGEYAMKEVPFHKTFIHGLIYGKSYWRKKEDGSIAYVSQTERLSYELGEPTPPEVQSKWEKMSKSKGNVIDPIEIISLYGADAMRMALCSSVTHARQIDLDRRRFEEYKNFSNKFWNATRFIFMNIHDLSENDLQTSFDESLWTLEDHWILSRLHACIRRMESSLESYDFDELANSIYKFFWDEFCAYYVELCKPYLFTKIGTPEQRTSKQKLLLYILSCSISSMHPICPFITEEIFQRLKNQFPDLKTNPSVDVLTRDLLEMLTSKACISAPFPHFHSHFLKKEAEKDFSSICLVLAEIRKVRAEMALAPPVMTDVYLSSTSYLSPLIESNQQILSSLVRLGKITFCIAPPSLAFSSSSKVEDLQITIPLPEEFKEREKQRLLKEIEKIQKQIEGSKTKLSMPQFIERAPASLVEQTKQKLEEDESTLLEITKKLSTF